MWTKAFDTVDCTTLWKILQTYGCPDKQFHYEMKALVSVGSEPIDFLKVVRLVFWSGVVGPGTNDFYPLQRAKFTGGIFLL